MKKHINIRNSCAEDEAREGEETVGKKKSEEADFEYPIRIYMRQMGRIRMLTPSEEAELFGMIGENARRCRGLFCGFGFMPALCGRVLDELAGRDVRFDQAVSDRFKGGRDAYVARIPAFRRLLKRVRCRPGAAAGFERLDFTWKTFETLCSDAEERFYAPYRELAARRTALLQGDGTQDRTGELEKITREMSALEKRFGMSGGKFLQDFAELLQRLRDVRCARNKVVEANLRLVISTVKEFRDRGLAFEDLVQEGNLGLVKAVERFEPGRNVRFSTYAVWWIRQAAGRAVADHGRTIRLPVHMVECVNRFMKARRRMIQEIGRWPTEEELAAELGIPAGEVREIERTARHPLSLQAKCGRDEDGTLEEIIPDAVNADPVEQAARSELLEGVQEALASLGTRERAVLDFRFGISDGRKRTLEEVGRALNVTRERVRQIEIEALRKLRQPGRARRLREYFACSA